MANNEHERKQQQQTQQKQAQEKQIAERLDVAGVMFDREQFEPIPSLYLSRAEADSLCDEMRKDGQWAREQLQAHELPDPDREGKT
jgi:hypothetical protein